MKTTWNHADAIVLCMRLEAIAMHCGGHVALTGSCLYGNVSSGKPIASEFKDVDIVIYRSADEAPFDWSVFWQRAEYQLGLMQIEDFGYCKKAVMLDGRSVELFDPFEEGEYGEDDIDDIDDSHEFEGLL